MKAYYQIKLVDSIKVVLLFRETHTNRDKRSKRGSTVFRISQMFLLHADHSKGFEADKDLNI